MKPGKAEIVYDEYGILVSAHYYDREGNEISAEEWEQAHNAMMNGLWEAQQELDRKLRGY